MCRHQQQLGIHMWAGIFGDLFVSLNLLPGNHYGDSLSHDLPKLLEDVPLAVTARMWYMHDGASTHFSRDVWDVLSNTYHYE
jgi:hypothetical protein